MGKYLHKDFHGAMSYCLQFVAERYGKEEVEEYLHEVARTVYRDLIQDIKNRGLVAWREHVERIFELEEGGFSIEEKEGGFDLVVDCCPAITHIQERGYPLYEDFCAGTCVVQAEIAKQAGVRTRTTLGEKLATCRQEFREGQP